ncbi:MAG: galactose mutarotase [Verrucomicrobia bacterium]|nr:galactose mutarotase [Verrucomicrobiota bacterium]
MKSASRHSPTSSRIGQHIAHGCGLALLVSVPAIGPVTPSATAADSARPRVLRVEQAEFGRTADGKAVEVFTLRNANGLAAKVITYGATLIAVETPDRDGAFANITLHLDSLADYLGGHPLLGSIVGRFANRIGGAKFTIDGTEFLLPANAAPHHIHGGRTGFQKRLWTARPVAAADSAGVELTLNSPDGEEGYPGAVRVNVVYRLTNRDELVLEYTATTDKPTHVNLTNHVYWNLGGAGSGDVLAHRLTLHSEQILAADDKKIPTGEFRAVRGTPFDFTAPHTIGARIKDVPAGGYDHCYVLPRRGGAAPAPFARVEDPKSGRVMDVSTTAPGVQVYTANYLNDRFKAGGKPYGPHHGICLETQHYPDAPNKPQFPSSLLRPGETYRQVTSHKFSVAK